MVPGSTGFFLTPHIPSAVQSDVGTQFSYVRCKCQGLNLGSGKSGKERGTNAVLATCVVRFVGPFEKGITFLKSWFKLNRISEVDIIT